jgi:hypothetical protein
VRAVRGADDPEALRFDASAALVRTAERGDPFADAFSLEQQLPEL